MVNEPSVFEPSRFDCINEILGIYFSRHMFESRFLLRWIQSCSTCHTCTRYDQQVPGPIYLERINWNENPDQLTIIRQTCLYKFDPLKPHFYIVKLGFTGVYIIFLFLLKNMDCGYSLELPQWGGSNAYPQPMFWAEIWKILEFFIWKFSVFQGEIFYIFE